MCYSKFFSSLRLLLFSATFFYGSTASAQNQSPPAAYLPEWQSLDARPTPTWWQDAKFGIFIHWGVYSVPAFTAKGNYAEWYQYALETDGHNGQVRDFHQKNYGKRTYYDLADDFKATQFKPEEWASLFEKAGARYSVLTSKHHDGFCLWPNAQASKTWGFAWDAKSRGPQRDLVGEYMAAFNKSKVKPGLYFSLYEWFNPLWKFDRQRYARDHAMPQLYEVVKKYNPYIVWADGDWDATPETWQSQQFLAWLYNESQVREDVVVNDRWGSGVRFNHGGVYTPEYQPDLEFDHPWEESRGIGHSYGLNRNEDAWNYLSGQALVLNLIDKVSRGGNFLLDVGPDAYGQIPPIMQDRLLEIGRWLEENGEAIYFSRKWRMSNQWSEGERDYQLPEGSKDDLLLKQTIDPEAGFAVKEVFYTWNPQSKSLYAILPKYPADGRVVLKNVEFPSGTEVTMLATKEKLRFETGNNQTTINLPAFVLGKYKSTHAFTLKIVGYGAFAEKPKIEVVYDPASMKANVEMAAVTPGAVTRFTVDGNDPGPNSPLYEAPFQPSGDATVKAKAFRNGMISSDVAVVEVKTHTMMPALSLFQQPSPALTAQVTRSAGDKYTVATAEKGTVLKTYDASEIQLDPSCETGPCGMVWRGYVKIPQTQGYQFWLESDDGSMLYLDGDLIVNNDGDHGMIEKSGTAFLAEGWHNIRIVYYNNGGGAGLRVWYAPIGGARQKIEGDFIWH